MRSPLEIIAPGMLQISARIEVRSVLQRCVSCVSYKRGFHRVFHTSPLSAPRTGQF